MTGRQLFSQGCGWVSFGSQRARGLSDSSGLTSQEKKITSLKGGEWEISHFTTAENFLRQDVTKDNAHTANNCHYPHVASPDLWPGCFVIDLWTRSFAISSRPKHNTAIKHLTVKKHVEQSSLPMVKTQKRSMRAQARPPRRAGKVAWLWPGSAGSLGQSAGQCWQLQGQSGTLAPVPHFASTTAFSCPPL